MTASTALLRRSSLSSHRNAIVAELTAAGQADLAAELSVESNPDCLIYLSELCTGAANVVASIHQLAAEMLSAREDGVFARGIIC